MGNYAYGCLGHVAGADASQIPHEIVAPFQRWVDQLDIQNTIFFRAEHLPNYELGVFYLNYFSTISPCSPSLNSALANFGSLPVLRVTVPGYAMGMLPHFAVVAHELGHAIQTKIKPDFSSHKQAADDCYKRIKTRLDTKDIVLNQKILFQISNIQNNWINELKADAVGHCVVGPAFFFALCGFLELSGRNYGVSSTHPPSSLRQTLLIKQLSSENKSFIDVFYAKTGLKIDKDTNGPHIPECPKANTLVQKLERNFDYTYAVICTELIPFISAIGADIYGAAISYLQTSAAEIIYTPDQLEADLKYHLDPLCNLVPPIETLNAKGAHAASLSSILNVGWAGLLTRLDNFPEPAGNDGDVKAKKMERLHELLLKAVELSEARLLWEEQQ